MDTDAARRLTDSSDVIWWPDWSPDGRWLSYVAYRASTGPRLEKVPVDGGDPVRITEIPVWKHVWANPDEIYFISVLKPEAGNIWSLSTEDGEARMMTDLSGKPGTLGGEALDTDGEYIYFTWEEDLGDIWLMDVVR
jgi:Tol biopolymer transport system component